MRHNFKHISKYLSWEFIDLVSFKSKRRINPIYKKKLRKIAKRKENLEVKKNISSEILDN